MSASTIDWYTDHHSVNKLTEHWLTLSQYMADIHVSADRQLSVGWVSVECWSSISVNQYVDCYSSKLHLTEKHISLPVDRYWTKTQTTLNWLLANIYQPYSGQHVFERRPILGWCMNWVLVNTSVVSINLPAFYHECRPLNGYTTHVLFCDR